jgi:hypothetical protein
MTSESDVKTDYDTGASSTTVTALEEQVQHPVIEKERYGTGKPKRVVIRAKVTHDDKSQS